MRRLSLCALFALTALATGCGYFNSLYNAERRFAEAERAARRGEQAAAVRAYSEAVERAAVSYRRYPASRWADDALLLIGRAHFALAQYEPARAALAGALAQSPDEDMRSAAALYLGATLVRLERPDSALVLLERALGGLEADSEPGALARLWRGRALLALGRPEGWADVSAVAARGGAGALEAALELAAQGVLTDDTARALQALARLAELEAGSLRADTVLGLLDRAARRWGPDAALRAVPERGGARWQPEPRTRLRHERARLLAQLGDTAAAVRAALAAAQLSNGEPAARARQDAAAWLVRRAAGAEDLAQARAILLPAIGDALALLDIRRLRTMEVLLEQARGGQAAALFAAAELARDSLSAPRLARQLFLTYADVAAGSVWAPKALLAALALSSGEERPPLEARIGAHRDNVYVAAALGRTDDAAFEAAETRLGRAVAAVREDAAARAQSGDLRVTRAVTVLDSLRALARADSMGVRCGSLLDSLALRGVRADSVRGACLRADSALVTRYLGMDTLLLRGGAAADSLRRRRAMPDTLTP